MITAPCPIPDAALDDRLGFVGTSGSGKTFGAGVAAERLLQRKSRLIIPDALGVWWGLRVAANGKDPSPWPVVIFGGPHGDIPIHEGAGGLIGEACASMAESAIVDLSEIGSKAGERRFMLAFLTALYRKASGEPVHIVFDEGDMWAPQQVRDKDGEAAKLLGMMETIVRRGRVKGFIPWLITQRPAVLNKDVLSQVDGLVAFKLTSTQDRDALGSWVEGQADKEDWRRMRGELAALERGRAVVWLPTHAVLETARFPAKATFDSSATPKRGEKKRTAILKPLDLPALQEKLSAIKAEAIENDPKRLKAEVARLQRELLRVSVTAPAIGMETVEAAERRGEARGHSAGLAEGIEIGEAKVRATIYGEAINAIRVALGMSPASAQNFSAPPPKRQMAVAPVADTTQRGKIIAQGAGGQAAVIHSDNIGKGERACLAAIATYPGGVRREQLTVLTGYKRSTRNTYLQRLQAQDLIEQAGDRVRATKAGIAALGDAFEPMPTGEALRERVLRELPEGERRVLMLAIDVWPDAIDRDAISAGTGYSRSTRNTYLQRLSARELVTTSGDGVRASDDLF